MVCPCCQQSIEDAEKFCRHCGVNTDAAAAYGQLVELALADGRIDESERAMLDTRATALGLAPELCAKIAVSLGRDPATTPVTAGNGRTQLSVPVTLTINRNRQFIQGMRGVLEFQVTNSTGRTLDDVRIVARIGNRRDELDEPFDLWPGQQERVLLEIDLGEICGELVVTAEVAGRDQDAEFNCRGQHAIRVLERPQAAGGNTQITLGDWVQKVSIHAQDSAIDASDMEMNSGSDPARMIREAIEAGRIRTANDYLEAWAKLPSDNHEIKLRFRSARPKVSRKRVSTRFGPSSAGPSAVSLRMHQTASESRILLFAESRVTFGRDRAPNDLVLRCLPRSEENDPGSMRISGRHGAFVWRDDDPGVENLKSANGTTLDGRPVGDSGPAPIRDGQTIRIGNALDLQVTRLPPPAGFDPSQYAGIAGLRLAHVRQVTGAVRLERPNNLRGESYLLIRDVAYIGSSPGAAVFIPGLLPVHAYLLACGKAIWLEAVAEGGVSIDGVPLQPGELVGLRPGLVLDIGTVRLAVGEREQLGL